LETSSLTVTSERVQLNEVFAITLYPTPPGAVTTGPKLVRSEIGSRRWLAMVRPSSIHCCFPL
jgi:hypothetical protein